MATIQELAADLAVATGTLRQAASRGTFHVSGDKSRDVQLAPGEREYLCAHWPLLSELRDALLPEYEVRLAVLYGSLARGDEDGGWTSTCWSRSPTTVPPQDSSLPAA